MPIQNRNLEPGTKLVATYKKETYHALVVASADGKVLYQLSPYDGKGLQESLVSRHCRDRKSLQRLGFLVSGYECCYGGDNQARRHCREREHFYRRDRRLHLGGCGGDDLRTIGGGTAGTTVRFFPESAQSAGCGRGTSQALLRHLPQQLHSSRRKEPRDLPHGPPTDLATTATPSATNRQAPPAGSLPRCGQLRHHSGHYQFDHHSPLTGAIRGWWCLVVTADHAAPHLRRSET